MYIITCSTHVLVFASKIINVSKKDSQTRLRSSMPDGGDPWC